MIAAPSSTTVTSWDTDDDAKRTRLARMRTIATAVLAVMAIVFALAARLKTAYPLLAWVEAFSEAALIGGLADWFAVVALFRHPGGIPFPHTAIVPSNKDRIGAQLGAFVEDNFLTPSNIAARLREFDLAGHLLRWLAVADNSRSLFATVRALTPRVVDAIDDDQIETVLRRVAAEEIARLDLAKTGADLLAIVTADRLHQRVLERILPVVAAWLDTQRPEIKRRFAKRSMLTPGWFDAFVVNRFVDGMVDLVGEIAADDAHPMRRAFDDYVTDFTARLRDDPETAAQAERAKRAVAQSRELDGVVTIAWNAVKSRLERPPSTAPSGNVRQDARLSAIAARIAAGLLAEPAVVARLNDRLCDGAETVLVQFKAQFSTLISDVVQRWDAQMIGDKIELEIGPDLQFVRLNGSLVGGAAGIALHAILVAAGAT